MWSLCTRLLTKALWALGPFSALWHCCGCEWQIQSRCWAPPPSEKWAQCWGFLKGFCSNSGGGGSWDYLVWSQLCGAVQVLQRRCRVWWRSQPAPVLTGTRPHTVTCTLSPFVYFWANKIPICWGTFCNPQLSGQRLIICIPRYNQSTVLKADFHSIIFPRQLKWCFEIQD